MLRLNYILLKVDVLFFNEPESDVDNKLQAGILKKIADGHKAILKTPITENIPKQIVDDSNEYISDSNIVLGFIMDKYEITGNDKDTISSSEIFNDFKNYTKDKMTQSKFKDDMLGISGVTCNR
ncbi:hypothetical protein T492DRAFT_835093 [Pavlovales sp. CCMP2436]|nr:hypothetical protein T492DRAFT_835093 [Pavlovales sp. CCMP2436]